MIFFSSFSISLGDIEKKCFARSRCEKLLIIFSWQSTMHKGTGIRMQTEVLKEAFPLPVIQSLHLG
jgi:hypothetical protein